jgi:ATP-dependent DNA helicase DinG
MMAELVRESYESGALAAIEAGTGIGKSFAYLAVALYHAMSSPDERTVIATSTINLQKQLYEKDLPMLFRYLGVSCKTALAVGRGNYVCILRFVQTRSESSLLSQDPQSELYQIGQWMKSTQTGLFADYPSRLSFELRGEICCDGDLCPNHSCEYFKECFFFKAKAKAKEAKVIVSNHHLLFTDPSRHISDVDYSEEMILPPFNRLIIDEAHNIEANATEYFTDEYSSKEMLRQIHRIQRTAGTTTNHCSSNWVSTVRKLISSTVFRMTSFCSCRRSAPWTNTCWRFFRRTISTCPDQGRTAASPGRFRKSSCFGGGSKRSAGRKNQCIS